MLYWKKLTDTEGKHLAGLDHLRAIAIILVFLCHYRAYERPQWVDVVGLFGWTGVDLFFVLSGYLIGEQLFRQVKHDHTINFKHFYISRFFRILPAYFFVVFIYFLFPTVRERDGIAPFWQFMTFTQNFDLDFGNEGTFSHAWSLCIEEQFYLLLPLTITAVLSGKYQKKAVYILVALFLSCAIVRGLSWLYFMKPYYDHGITEGRFVTYNKWVYYPTYNRLDGLLVGVSIAALLTFYPEVKKRLAKWGNRLFIVGVILITIAYFFLKNDRLDFWPTLIGYPLIAVSYGFMVLAVLCPSCFLYRLRWKLSTLIAALSYGVYLCHKFLNHLLQRPLDHLGIPSNSNWRVLICAFISILVALLLNRIIEHPFMRWKNKILRKKMQKPIVDEPILIQ
ncbi:acyltransferase family protein [Olivibacter domesticus]|uniref:Peptidoglycan/LPS O-acetylase OafA/YrhL, contains acyltransferase and SGNH-hydrolase domains n=1 Tax=Olivibacter domesticus TaxID=407022 RepID=A0A1H7M611_OLID1|nr:acyltransferase [Olivibacter domesticus]SEL06539.1 Peptidoglycan/LPS O-acetylase OafA/YrhL, contains acyltransferase and SGNH-hydrolase domains [Olivibacter domesticus]